MPVIKFCKKRNANCAAKTCAEYAKEFGLGNIFDDIETPVCESISDFCEYVQAGTRLKSTINDKREEIYGERGETPKTRKFSVSGEEFNGEFEIIYGKISNSTINGGEFEEMEVSNFKKLLIGKKIKIEEITK